MERDRVEEIESSRLANPTHTIPKPIHTPPRLLTKIRLRTHDGTRTPQPLAATGSAFVDEVAGATAADVEDGRIAGLLALELFVEAEDGALAGLVGVADAAAARGKVAARRGG